MANGATNSALAICEVLHERVHDVLARKGPRFDLIDGRPLPNIPCLPHPRPSSRGQFWNVLERGAAELKTVVNYGFFTRRNGSESEPFGYVTE
jgi:hypothetical protein